MNLAFHSSCGLGDHLLHCHYMRKLAAKYPEAETVFYCRPHHWAQLHEVIQDMPAIRLAPFGLQPVHSVEVPLFGNDPRVEYVDRLDFIDCKLRQYDVVSRSVGLLSPMTCREDWLFDYPALRNGHFISHDVLVINAPPMSRQWSGYSATAFDGLLHSIAKRKMTFVTTHPNCLTGHCTTAAGLSVTQVGRLSLFCRCIVAVSTGPSWPCWNIWNKDTPRVILIDSERVNLGPRTEHCATVDEAAGALKAWGLL